MILRAGLRLPGHRIALTACEGLKQTPAPRERPGSASCLTGPAARAPAPDRWLFPGAHATALRTELGQAITSAGLPRTVIGLDPRSGQWYGPMPRTGAQAHALTDDQLTRLIRIWLANRGVWQALPGAGPTVPVPATRGDVARYVEDYTELLAELH